MGIPNLVAFNSQIIGSSSYSAMQLGKQRELWVGERHGRYYASSYAGLSGYVASQAVATLVAPTTTAYTGLAVQNPTGSGVNLVLQRAHAVCGLILTSVIQAIVLVDGTGVFTVGDSLKVSNNILGGAVTAFKAVVSANVTVAATQVVARPLVSSQIVAGSYSAIFDAAGEIIVAPGHWLGFACIGTATASSFLGSLSWEEVPV